MINGQTKVYGIIGNPVRHSKSPVMQNAAFEALAVNAVYVPFPVDNIDHAVSGIRGLGICGMSVTIPFKETILAHLDEIDHVARKIGAVNTVTVVEREGKRLLSGYNTDWFGAIGALSEKTSLAGKKAVVLGAGGSARAIGFGLLEHQVEISLCSRTETTGRLLADELGCSWLPLLEIPNLTGDILINATSVGMAPKVDQSLVPREVLRNFPIVMDIVYSPLRTRLLQDAEEMGCTTIHGLEMLLHQGVAQFELWTGQPAPIEVMRKALRASLEGN